MSEATEQVNESSEKNLPPAKQESMEEVESVINMLESLKIETSHTLRCQPILRSTSQHRTDQDNNVHYKTRLNKIHMYIRMMMSMQPKILLQKPLQLSQNSHIQYFFLPVMSPYQLKR